MSKVIFYLFGYFRSYYKKKGFLWGKFEFWTHMCRLQKLLISKFYQILNDYFHELKIHFPTLVRGIKKTPNTIKIIKPYNFPSSSSQGDKKWISMTSCSCSLSFIISLQWNVSEKTFFQTDTSNYWNFYENVKWQQICLLWYTNKCCAHIYSRIKQATSSWRLGGSPFLLWWVINELMNSIEIL